MTYWMAVLWILGGCFVSMAVISLWEDWWKERLEREERYVRQYWAHQQQRQPTPIVFSTPYSDADIWDTFRYATHAVSWPSQRNTPRSTRTTTDEEDEWSDA